MEYTLEGLQALMTSILLRPGNNPNDEVKPAELKTILDYMVGLQQAQISGALTTAAATAGSEQTSIPGGVNTVALENLPLSTGAGAVVTGYPLQIGSTLLLPAQTNKIENGVYEVTAEGLKRLEGYDTASGLSRVNVAIKDGNQAGDIWQQPNTLTSDNAEKTFNQVNNLSEAIKAIASSLIEEESEVYFDFDGTENEDTGEFTPKYEYAIGDLVGNFQIKRIWKSQPSFDKILKKNQWSYDATTGLLTLSPLAVSNMRKAEGHEIRLDLASRGTMGLASGFVFRVIAGLPYYRFGNETDAELRLAGESLNVANTFVIANNPAEVAAAKTGDLPKLILEKGKPNALELYNPPVEENVFTHSPRV